jgi:hypothetical protein
MSREDQQTDYKSLRLVQGQSADFNALAGELIGAGVVTCQGEKRGRC